MASELRRIGSRSGRRVLIAWRCSRRSSSGASAPGFWIEVVIGGLMAGVLYSLVALGFVLIFKASGVFNFAQGAMVLFAALTRARGWSRDGCRCWACALAGRPS